jgi:hypothetical protein
MLNTSRCSGSNVHGLAPRGRDVGAEKTAAVSETRWREVVKVLATAA